MPENPSAAWWCTRLLHCHFESQNDVLAQYRKRPIRVPARHRFSGRLRQLLRERWCLQKVLVSGELDLSYPIAIFHEDEPDFRIESSDSKVLVELTEGGPNKLQAARTRASIAGEFGDDFEDEHTRMFGLNSIAAPITWRDEITALEANAGHLLEAINKKTVKSYSGRLDLLIVYLNTFEICLPDELIRKRLEKAVNESNCSFGVVVLGATGGVACVKLS